MKEDDGGTYNVCPADEWVEWYEVTLSDDDAPEISAGIEYMGTLAGPVGGGKMRATTDSR